jgi:hypothetical protein
MSVRTHVSRLTCGVLLGLVTSVCWYGGFAMWRFALQYVPGWQQVLPPQKKAFDTCGPPDKFTTLVVSPNGDVACCPDEVASGERLPALCYEVIGSSTGITTSSAGTPSLTALSIANGGSGSATGIATVTPTRISNNLVFSPPTRIHMFPGSSLTDNQDSVPSSPPVP